MKLHSVKIISKFVAAGLTAATSLAFASVLPSSITQATRADWVKTRENSSLSINDDSATVYFGTYNGRPVKNRILDTKTSAFGGNTLFLNSEDVLFDYVYDADGNNEWKNEDEYVYSDLYMYLNYRFIFDTYSASEQAAIISSVKGGGSALEKDKIFVPSEDEISSGDKASKGAAYWLRTKDCEDKGLVDIADPDGRVTKENVNKSLGVAPAFNIDLDSIVLASKTSAGTYKLTLKDSRIDLKVPGSLAEYDGNKVTVPYEILGTNSSNVNQVSVLILSGEYGDPDNSILYYSPLNNTYSGNGEKFTVKGSGSFSLPSDLDISVWGSTFHVYVLAEDINGVNKTDYSSDPVELKLV